MWAWAVASFMVGVVSGLYLHYITVYNPLRKAYLSLVENLYKMKRQGFVPQYEVENPRPIDLSEGITER